MPLNMNVNAALDTRLHSHPTATVGLRCPGPWIGHRNRLSSELHMALQKTYQYLWDTLLGSCVSSGFEDLWSPFHFIWALIRLLSAIVRHNVAISTVQIKSDWVMSFPNSLKFPEPAKTELQYIHQFLVFKEHILSTVKIK